MKRTFTQIMMVAILVTGFAALTEAREAGRKTFDVQLEAMDHNGDKQVSEYEFTRKMSGQAKERAKKEFKSRDTNGDGKLQLKEFGKL